MRGFRIGAGGWRWKRRTAAALLAGLAVAAWSPSRGGAQAAEEPCRETVTPAAAPTPVRALWFLPDDAADAWRLGLWCETVGRAVVRPLPDTLYGGGDSLAVVTWNVHVGGGDVERLVADLRAGGLTGGRPVRHFVVLLQEAYRADEALPDFVPEGMAPARVAARPPSGERRGIVQTAERLGLALYYVPSMRNGIGPAEEDKGNAVLSSVPVCEVRAVELPFEVQRRVAAFALVEGTTERGTPWRLRVGSVHFDTRAPLLRFWASLGGGRRRQAEMLTEVVAPDEPVVVGGDLNTWSARFLEDALPYLRREFADARRLDEEPTFTVGWLGRDLDHLFARLPGEAELRYRRLDDRYGSDHYPLLGWVPLAGLADRSASPFEPCAAAVPTAASTAR